MSTVITGATTVDQVKENMKAIQLLEQIENAQMAQINAILES